jgi:hypothetical protein
MTDRHDDFERQLHDRLAAAEARVDASPGAPNLSAAFRSAWLRPAVVVATVAAAALAGALLVDQIPDRRVGDASSSPGAGVSAQARDGDFVLTLASPRATWTTQDAIQVTATLSYMGHEQGATIGAGGGPVVFSLQQLSGGTAALEGGQRLSCIHYSLGPGAALSRPFA